MRPAVKLPRALTDRCKAAAAVFILLFCAGCAARAPALPPAPEVVSVALCPAPPAPALPALDPALLLDDPANAARLMERDDIYRRYIEGLRATIACYEDQVRAVTALPKEKQ